MPQHATLLHRPKTASPICFGSQRRLLDLHSSSSFEDQPCLQESASSADASRLLYVEPRTSTIHYGGPRVYPGTVTHGCESDFICSGHSPHVEQSMCVEVAPWLNGELSDFNVNSSEYTHEIAYFRHASGAERACQPQHLATELFLHSSNLDRSPVIDSAGIDYMQSVYSPGSFDHLRVNECYGNNGEIFTCDSLDRMSDSTVESQVSDGRNVDEPYAKLIYKALMAAPNHSMVLQEIYEWFLDNTDKKKTTEGWKNSIRHNLSMNAAFRKTDRQAAPEEAKKSSEWMLESFAVENGVTPTTRYRKSSKKIGRSRYPTLARQLAGASGGKQSGKVRFMRRVRDRCSRSTFPSTNRRTRKGPHPHPPRNASPAYARQTSPSTPSENDLRFLPSSCFDQDYSSSRCQGQAVYNFAESEGAFMDGLPRYDVEFLTSGDDVRMSSWMSHSS